MYSDKLLRFEFENYTGAFDDKGNTSLSISNCKAMCKVSYYGNSAGFQTEVTLYGLGLELIAALSAKGIGPYTDQLARIGMTIYANDTQVFAGQILSSYANMNAVPDASLVISAMAGLELGRRAAKPFSLQGSQPYKDMLEAICKNNGYTFRGVGIDGIIATNPYFNGSVLDQIRYACNAAGISYAVNGKNITAWRQGKKVDDVVPLVSKDYGLIGYPVFTPSGITFQSQFSTYLAQGRYVKLITDLPHASGTYQLFAVDHYLSSWVQDGPWMTISQGTKIPDAGTTKQQ